MNPQGSSVINTQQYDAYIDSVNSVTDCKSLQEVVDGVFASIQAELSAITDQLDKLLPLQALLDPPVTPDDVIEWIEGLIDSIIKPLVAPYTSLQLQVAAITLKIAELTQVITDKMNSIGSCQIDIPTP